LTYYIDTSLLVAALVVEPHTSRVLGWLEGLAPGTAFISDWTHVEVESALSLKHRTGVLSLELRSEASLMWRQLHRSGFPTLAVTPDHFESAARMAGQPDLGLRAGDALHVAIARESAYTLVTLDKRMAEAALQIGVPVELL
jgi:predicted nucleic acid-binding protein